MAQQKQQSNSKENFYLVLNLILAVVTMGLVAALTGAMMAEDFNKVSLFLGLSILSQILFQLLLFVIKEKRRDKIRASIIAAIYVAAMVTAFIATSNHSLIFISNALVFFAVGLNQFLLVEKEKTKKGIITNILLGIVLFLLAISTLLNIGEEYELKISLVTAFLFLFMSLKKLLFPSLKIEKIKLLINILIKTHTIDTLICLFAFVIAFSFILPMFEENITNFWDAMWYCFTVITTIGFGDFAAESLIGRILTVILGIYGIVVVAILTSVIVNFYNEVSAKEKARDIIE